MFNPPKDLHQIYKYACLESAREIIKNKTLKFANPYDFNDPFDCNKESLYYDIIEAEPLVVKDIKILLKQFPFLIDNPDMLNDGFKASVERKLEKSGVTCFSTLSNDGLMWAHYANGYRGVCFGFDNKDISKRFFNVKIHVEGEVLYGEFPPFNYCKNKIEGIQRVFLTKDEFWRYESEYRVLTLAGPGYYMFDSSFLTNIVFGARVTKETIVEIKELCDSSELNVSFYKSIIVGSKLVYEPC